MTCKAKAKAKDLSFKAKAKDLTFKAKAKAKDLSPKAKTKDMKIVLKDSLRTRPRPRTNITERLPAGRKLNTITMKTITKFDNFH